jgi:hypothetical protein
MGRNKRSELRPLGSRFPSMETSRQVARVALFAGNDISNPGLSRGVALGSMVPTTGLLCLFCGRVRTGGVAGPTPDIYICPECIRLAAEILDEQDAPMGPSET